MALRQKMLSVVRTDKTGLAGTIDLHTISFLLDRENQEESFFFIYFSKHCSCRCFEGHVGSSYRL